MTANPTLILLPGLLCDKALWESQIKALTPLANIIVPDLTRHNRMADLASEVLRAAPSKFALAGLSMGGYVAFEILRQAPGRVLKVAFLDTTARPDTPEQTERRTGLIELSRKGRFKGVTPRLLPMLIHPEHLENKAITDTIMDMAERVGKEAFERQQTAILHRVDSRPDLTSIRCRTLVICGRQDALTPPELAKEIAENVAGKSRLGILNDCGHLSALERPDKVASLMKEWLMKA